MVYLFLGAFGGWEILLLVIALLLLFGGRKIPELMRGIGKGIREFKEGRNPSGEDTEEDNETYSK